ncbi:MAG: S8 family serine peptidase [Firmicutes bacterium]|nr:S8 family serine peptidase [Bacillota bacterium]
MLTYNDAKREKCGLTEWHNKGLKGQGITVAVLDEWPFITEYMDREIYSAPLGEGKSITHGTWVAQVVHEAAPGAKIVMLPFFNSTEDKKKAIAWLKENHVDIINMSMKLGSCDWLWPDMEALDALVVAAGGNDGEDKSDLAEPARFDWTIGVGGIYENGTLQHCNTIGESMDCVAYTGVYALNTKGRAIPFHGTSCAAPWLSGMLATYYTGREVPPVGVVREMIKANCRDMDETGKDSMSGYGFFVMPDTCQEVEVPEQEVMESEDESMEIVLTIGSHAAEVNGESVALDCAPFASQGRTFVPLRFIAEALGCRVDYKEGIITIRA